MTTATPSTPKEPDKTPAHVAYSDCLRFLSSHGVKAECPTCGNKKSSVHTEGDGLVKCTLVMSADYCADGSLTPRKTGLGMFLTECNNCGNIRTFSYWKLAEWVKNHPEDSTGE